MRSKLKRNPRSLGVSVAWEENRRATRQTGITIAPSAFTDPDILKELMLALASPDSPPAQSIVLLRVEMRALVRRLAG
jgi:hypothetical protein